MSVVLTRMGGRETFQSFPGLLMLCLRKGAVEAGMVSSPCQAVERFWFLHRGVIHTVLVPAAILFHWYHAITFLSNCEKNLWIQRSCLSTLVCQYQSLLIWLVLFCDCAGRALAGVLMWRCLLSTSLLCSHSHQRSVHSPTLSWEERYVNVSM